MTKRRITRLRKIPAKQHTVSFEEGHKQQVMPFDEKLFEHARILWQFGDWSRLARIERDAMQHHPERAKLALLAAAALLQIGDAENARYFVQLAKDWGCNRHLINQILVAGVHNSLGRAVALTSNQGRAIQHFEEAVDVGVSVGDSKLLSQVRMSQQLNEYLQYTNVIQYEEPKETIAGLYSNHAGYVTDKWDLYLKVYNSLFADYKKKSVSLLEVGIQNGGSLEIWEKFFKNSKVIVGCDIDEKCAGLIYESKKIKLVIGDINQEKTRDLIASYSAKFDVIIDDGSHKSSDIINTFCSLFCVLESGGVYIIEDLHCSYWEGWGGGLNEPLSAVSFLKKLVDIINCEHWELEKNGSQLLIDSGFSFVNESLLAQIHSIKFYNSMCVIEKKQEIYNLLGVRRVVGTKELVGNVKHLNGLLL